MIFSSDKEYTLWPDPGTALTVDLDGTSLTLPVVGGAAAMGLGGAAAMAAGSAAMGGGAGESSADSTAPWGSRA